MGDLKKIQPAQLNSIEAHGLYLAAVEFLEKVHPYRELDYMNEFYHTVNDALQRLTSQRVFHLAEIDYLYKQAPSPSAQGQEGETSGNPQAES